MRLYDFYVIATEDRLVSSASLDMIKYIVPSIGVIALPAPHMVLQVCPEAAAEAIAEFAAHACQWTRLDAD
jgi:hypothetical protein